jgi:hypothetical protein
MLPHIQQHASAAVPFFKLPSELLIPQVARMLVRYTETQDPPNLSVFYQLFRAERAGEKPILKHYAVYDLFAFKRFFISSASSAFAATGFSQYTAMPFSIALCTHSLCW